MLLQSWHLKGCQNAAINKDNPFRELQASLDELKERGSDLVLEEIDAHSWVDLESDLTATQPPMADAEIIVTINGVQEEDEESENDGVEELDNAPVPPKINEIR